MCIPGPVGIPPGHPDYKPLTDAEREFMIQFIRSKFEEMAKERGQQCLPELVDGDQESLPALQV